MEAQEMAAELGLTENMSPDDLKQIIQKKNETKLHSLISSLEEKYSNKSSQGKKKRKAEEIENEPPTEKEFQAIQEKLMSKRKDASSSSSSSSSSSKESKDTQDKSPSTQKVRQAKRTKK